MTKRRTIDPRIRASETFACLTYRQRDLWIGLILMCDDQGRMPGQSAYIRSAVWPYDDVQISEVDADLAALESIGNIMRYRIDGRTYIQLVNWHKYQAAAEWLGKSEYPAPDDWQDHYRYTGPGRKIFELNWDTRQGVPSQVPAPVPAPVPALNDKDKDNENDNDNDKVKDNTTTGGGGGSQTEYAFKRGDLITVGKAYQSRIGRINDIIQQELSIMLTKYPLDWILEAIEIAALNNVRKLVYIDGVLKRKLEEAAVAVTRADYSEKVER